MITLDQKDDIATILLNNPPVNILSMTDIEELINIFKFINKDSSLKMVVIRSSIESFSVGMNIKEHSNNEIPHLLTLFKLLIKEIVNCPMPVISVLQGHCYGGGLEIALLADITLASTSAMLAFPEIKLAHMAPLAHVILHKICGMKHATSLLLSGETISADRAYSLGLVSKIFEENMFNNALDDYISTASMLSASALRANKRAICALNPFDEALYDKVEAIYLSYLNTSPDPEEGVTSFLEKRKPVWS